MVRRRFFSAVSNHALPFGLRVAQPLTKKDKACPAKPNGRRRAQDEETFSNSFAIARKSSHVIRLYDGERSR
jgi:hypothetical protein